MICPDCSFDNPEGVKFCGECGKPQLPSCSACGFENPIGFKFCGNCGTQIIRGSIQTPGSNEASQVNKDPDAERRRLTVMFCDMVGSTALSHELDPEDLRSVVRQYQEVCQKEVAKYEGHIAQYLGDGILIYFGYPTAHENDAHRAISSGLGILNSITKLNQQLQHTIGTSISIRIGIHIGLVVIGSMGEKEQSQQLALGAAPNIAAKLEGLAQPNSMVISAHTFELVEGHFKFKDLGKHKIKGVEPALRVYQVIGDTTALKRFDPDTTSNKIPLVGRDEEVQQLLKYWEDAKRGHSHVIMLSGEAGLGKSRILETMITRIAHEDDLWLIPHQSSPYHQKISYHPITQTMKRLGLELTGDEDTGEQLHRLEQFLNQFQLPLPEMVPLFAGIMAISLEDSEYRSTPFSIEQQNQKLKNAMLSIYMGRAKEKNLLLVFEDLHWMDTASLGVINQLVSQSPKINMLTLVTFRPEFEPMWRLKPHLIMMPLSNLFDDAIKAIIDKIAKGKQLPASLVDQIIQKTDGVPLFVEELTKMVLNSEMMVEHEDRYELNGPLSSLTIPNTVHDSLVARLDRMAVARKIAQVGSVIGREFEYSLIMAASEMEEVQLRKCLDQLVQAELLLQSGAFPDASFKFKHALIRDAAYQSLLKSRRQQLHALVASTMINQYPSGVLEHPATTAYHFEKGGMVKQAIEHWLMAGNKVIQHQAFEEALEYLQRALKLLPELKSEADKSALELKILAVQAPIFLMTAGWASELTFIASSRLEQLAEEHGDQISLFKALRISTIYELFNGIPSKALNKAKKALAIAKDVGKIDFKIEAYRLIGQTSIFNGLLLQSKESFDSAISLNSSNNIQVSSELGDPGIISLIQSSHVLWQLGYPDQGIQRAEMALSQAQKSGHPYDLCICLFLSSMVAHWCGNTALCLEHSSRCVDLSKEFGIKFFGQESITFVGASQVINGNVQQGLEMMIDAIAARPNLARQGFPVHSTTLADICLTLGKYEIGLDIMERSFELFDDTNDQFLRSEVFRIKGDLLFGQDYKAFSNEIESCYSNSLEISRSQAAKSLELRTAMSIAHLRKSQGRIAEGLDLVSNLYSSFEEGFTTKDLIKAKTLIDEMSVSSPLD